MEFLDDVNNLCLLEPTFDDKNAIVLITGKHELCDSVVSLASIIENASRKNKYDIIIIHDDLDYYDEDAIKHMCEKTDSNIEVRLQKIKHRFNEGYIHIDKRYSNSFVSLAYLPFLIKRYSKLLYVSNATLMKSNIYELFNDSMDYSGINCYIESDRLVAVLFDVAKFRMNYSSLQIKDALSGIRDSNKLQFFTNLNKTSCETIFLKDAPISYEFSETEYYQNAYKTPFFEKYIFEKQENKEENKNAEPRFCGAYLFPFEKVKKGSRVVLYGNGNVGNQFLRQINQTQYCEVVALCDRTVSKEITPIENIANISFDYVIIAISSEIARDEVIAKLTKIGVDKNQIIDSIHRELFV